MNAPVSKPLATATAGDPPAGDDWRAEILSRLVEASDEEISTGELSPASSLRDDLGLGSLAALELVLDLEDQYGIEVDDEELVTLVTVGDLLAVVERKRGEAGAF